MMDWQASLLFVARILGVILLVAQGIVQMVLQVACLAIVLTVIAAGFAVDFLGPREPSSR